MMKFKKGYFSYSKIEQKHPKSLKESKMKQFLKQIYLLNLANTTDLSWKAIQ